MIWIIGGTSEAREFLTLIKDRMPYVITVATECGSQAIGDDNVIQERLDHEGMVGLIHEKSIGTVVDLSHPYAVDVSRIAKEAAMETNTRYFRYVRPKTEDKSAIHFDTLEQCRDYLSNQNGTVFFTTGSKNIGDFEPIKGQNRFVYRVLPALFSIKECNRHSVDLADIVAMRGPVSEELNIAMFREYQTDFVVMKDSGIKGGTPEKINACRQLGIKALIIGRVPESGIGSLDELLQAIGL